MEIKHHIGKIIAQRFTPESLAARLRCSIGIAHQILDGQYARKSLMADLAYDLELDREQWIKRIKKHQRYLIVKRQSYKLARQRAIKRYAFPFCSVCQTPLVSQSLTTRICGFHQKCSSAEWIKTYRYLKKHMNQHHIIEVSRPTWANGIEGNNILTSEGDRYFRSLSNHWYGGSKTIRLNNQLAVALEAAYQQHLKR